MDQCALDPDCEFIGIIEKNGASYRRYNCNNGGQDSIKDYEIENSDEDSPTGSDNND